MGLTKLKQQTVIHEAQTLVATQNMPLMLIPDLVAPSHSKVAHQTPPLGHSWSPSQHHYCEFCHVLQFCCALTPQVGYISPRLTNEKMWILNFATGLGSCYSQWTESCIQKVIIPPVSGKVELLWGRTYITPREDEIKAFRHAKEHKHSCYTYW